MATGNHPANAVPNPFMKAGSTQQEFTVRPEDVPSILMELDALGRRPRPDDYPPNGRPTPMDVGQNPFGSSSYQVAGPVVPFVQGALKLAERSPTARRLIEGLASEAIAPNPFEEMTPSTEPFEPGKPQTPQAGTPEQPKEAKELRKRKYKLEVDSYDYPTFGRGEEGIEKNLQRKHRVKVMDREDNQIAKVDFEIVGDTVHIDSITTPTGFRWGQQGDKPQDASRKPHEAFKFRDMLIAFRDQFPEVKKLSAERISGARGQFHPGGLMMKRDLDKMLPAAEVVEHPKIGEAFDRQNMRAFDEEKGLNDEMLADHNRFVSEIQAGQEKAVSRREKAVQYVRNFGKPEAVTPETNIDFQLRDTLQRSGFNFRKPTVVIDTVVEPFSSQDYSGIMHTNPETNAVELEIAPYGSEGLVRVPFSSRREAMAFLTIANRDGLKPTRDFLQGASNKMREVLGIGPEQSVIE